MKHLWKKRQEKCRFFKISNMRGKMESLVLGFCTKLFSFFALVSVCFFLNTAFLNSKGRQAPLSLDAHVFEVPYHSKSKYSLLKYIPIYACFLYKFMAHTQCIMY